MSPSNIVLLSLIALFTISMISCVIGLNSPLFVLNENQIFYLYSTSAQVLAGIYGLTLTGFIFFRNELSREEFEDDTLTEAVVRLKKRYFTLLIFVTFFSIFTLLISNLVISVENGNNSKLITTLMNIGQSSFFLNLLVISYFIFDVVAPKRIEKESKIIQQTVDPMPVEDGKGSLEAFLTNYNQLEYIIQKYGKAYQSEFDNRSGRTHRRLSNIRLAEFILRAEKIDNKLFERIKNLVSLRNSIIHGAEPIVSKKVVDDSEKILNKLAEALNVVI